MSRRRKVDGGRVRQVVRSVIQSKPRGYLTLLARLQRLLRLDFARHTANVESAMPLTSDVRASVEAGLKNLYGPGVNAVFAQNRDLIGGIRIKVDSDVYDGSVRAGLASLENRF